MDLAEYKAKELFKEIGIPIVEGITVDNINELEGMSIQYPVAIKAQVHTGGRGKKGGILFAKNEEELISNSQRILGSNINGYDVNKLLIVPKIDIDREFYISILLDRDTKTYLLLFSPEGGVNIEELARIKPELMYRLYIDPIVGIQYTDAIFLADRAKIKDENIRNSFVDLVLRMYD